MRYRSIDFKVTKYKKLTDVISDFTLQITFKTLPLTEFRCSIIKQYVNSLKWNIKYSYFQILMFIRLDILFSSNNNILQQTDWRGQMWKSGCLLLCQLLKILGEIVFFHYKVILISNGFISSFSKLKIYIKMFPVLIFIIVNIDRYKPYKQKFFGDLNFYNLKGFKDQEVWELDML